MTYTQVALIALAGSVVLDVWVLRTRLLLRRPFWVAYAIILLFQLISNGVLTGTSIVQYSDAAILGSDTVAFVGDGRLVWAPVEDVLFGFSLVLQTLAWWVWWGRRGVQWLPLAGPPRWRRRSGGASGAPGSLDSSSS